MSMHTTRAPIQYKDVILPVLEKSNCGDKTILRPSYLHNGISYTGKASSLYWVRAQIPSQMASKVELCHPEHIIPHHVSYPTDSPTTIRLRLWSSLSGPHLGATVMGSDSLWLLSHLNELFSAGNIQNKDLWFALQTFLTLEPQIFYL